MKRATFLWKIHTRETKKLFYSKQIDELTNYYLLLLTCQLVNLFTCQLIKLFISHFDDFHFENQC